MRYKDTNLLNSITEYIDEFFDKQGVTPSVRCIAAAFGIGVSTAFRYLRELDESGVIRFRNGELSTPHTEKFSRSCTTAPMFDSVVKCGSPDEVESSVLEYVSLPDSIFGTSDMFIVTASGDSMVDEGIYEGDYVVVESTSLAGKGDLVIALDDEGRNTLKRYAGFDSKKGKYILEYRNEEVYPEETIELDDLEIQGVAKFIIRSL